MESRQMKKPDPTKYVKLLNRREVAELIGIHPDTAKRWARQGHLPKPLKVGPGKYGAQARSVMGRDG